MSIKSDDNTGDHPALLDDIILNEDDLTEEAKNQFGYHTEILDAFQRNRRAILENDQLSPEGRDMIFTILDKSYTIAKRVLNYAAANTELINASLPSFGPLIMCGFPRTGSTFLYSLLACDPNCRAPVRIDMSIDCIPPVSRSDMDERKRRCFKDKEYLEKICLVNKPFDFHSTFVIGEDSSILLHAGVTQLVALLDPIDRTEFQTWFYDKTNKGFAYAYHETFLRIMNSVDKPSSHWLLKSPFHAPHLDALFQQYPHAALIMTHRNLDEVVPSYCRLLSPVLFHFGENKSLGQQILKTRILEFFDESMESILEFRTSKSDKHEQIRKNVFDVMYDNLLKNPVAVVRQIYDHFGLRWSQEFETAMYDWLRENPQYKHGRNIYSLSDFDLTHEDIATRFGPYIDLFLRPSSSLEDKDDK